MGVRTGGSASKMEREGAEIVARVTDGREAALGRQAEVEEAAREITDFTGGSSGGGRWSLLWGYGLEWRSGSYDTPWDPELAERVAREAADFQAQAGAQLSEGANMLLTRLASLERPARPPKGPS
jgi:hypothetical protein